MFDSDNRRLGNLLQLLFLKNGLSLTSPSSMLVLCSNNKAPPISLFDYVALCVCKNNHLCFNAFSYDQLRADEYFFGYSPSVHTFQQCIDSCLSHHLSIHFDGTQRRKDISRYRHVVNPKNTEVMGETAVDTLLE